LEKTEGREEEKERVESEKVFDAFESRLKVGLSFDSVSFFECLIFV